MILKVCWLLTEHCIFLILSWKEGWKGCAFFFDSVFIALHYLWGQIVLKQVTSRVTSIYSPEMNCQLSVFSGWQCNGDRDTILLSSVTLFSQSLESNGKTDNHNKLPPKHIIINVLWRKQEMLEWGNWGNDI